MIYNRLKGVGHLTANSATNDQDEGKQKAKKKTEKTAQKNKKEFSTQPISRSKLCIKHIVHSFQQFPLDR